MCILSGLQCVYNTASYLCVADANAKWLFPLAIEFEIPKLREECEQFYDNLLTSSKKNEDHVDFLRLPHCSNVPKIYELAISHLAMQKMEEIKAVQGFAELSAEVTTNILTSRLKCFEDGTLKKECDVNIFQVGLLIVAYCDVIGSIVAYGDIIGSNNSMVSCLKGPTRHAYAWQIGPFWQGTIDIVAYVDIIGSNWSRLILKKNRSGNVLSLGWRL